MKHAFKTRLGTSVVAAALLMTIAVPSQAGVFSFVKRHKVLTAVALTATAVTVHCSRTGKAARAGDVQAQMSLCPNVMGTDKVSKKEAPKASNSKWHTSAASQPGWGTGPVSRVAAKTVPQAERAMSASAMSGNTATQTVANPFHN